MMKLKLLSLMLILANTAVAQRSPTLSEEQLGRWRIRFPEADTNGDGKLSVAEAQAYRNKIQTDQKSDARGVARQLTVDPRWEKKAFPEDAVSYYECWIDFALKYNPEMKFYLADAWPQLDQLEEIPTSPDQLTPALFDRLGREKNAIFETLVGELRKKYGERVFIMPTSDAMVLAVRYFHEGRLPGVGGVHRLIGNKERSLWRDRLGHLGPGLDQLEGYVFYATLYGKSPALIEQDISFAGVSDFPSPPLDQTFREIAWKAVVNNPLSGVVDKNHDGIGDE